MLTYTMSDLEYHARSELSSTGARHILDSPARFKYWQEHPEPPKTAFDVGSAAHTKILGTGSSIIVVPDEHLTDSGNISTKAATREWLQGQRDAGLTPIGRADAERVDAMAEAVLADRDARGVLETISGREVSIVQEVQGVPVRARFDILGGTHGGDLKTARDASPHGFNRAVGAHGYHIQEAWYQDAFYAETGQTLDWFKFVVVEVAPPHLVGVYELDPMWMDIAAGKAFTARETYKRCVETDTWPGYGASTLTAPTWAVYEADDEPFTFKEGADSGHQ